MNVVMVDDEESSGRLFQQRLRKEIRAHQVDYFFCLNGTDALETLARLTPGLTLVFTDIKMPGISGLELLKQIRDRFPQVKVFIISAFDTDEYRQAALAGGADGFFSKPFEFSDMKTLLEEHGLV